MHVIVVGAGIGGLALAGGLLADGHQVQVLEAAPQLRAGGAAVTIFHNGHAALAGLNVPSAALGGVVEQMEFQDATGHRQSLADLRPLVRRSGFPVATIPRSALLSHLAAQLPPGLITFGAAAESVIVDESGASVTDANGTAHQADVVVGADGQASAIRRATVDPAPAAPAGWTTWQGLTPALPELAAGNRGLCLVGEAGLVGLMPAGGGLLQWWFDIRTPSVPVERAHVPAMLRARFRRYADPVPQLLGGVTERDVGEYPHVLHQIPDAWGRGATTLVGDAAHAFPPSQAQGANQALEDAWVLTRALRGTGPVADRLRGYERRRVPRVRRISRMAASEVTNEPLKGARRIAAALLPPGLTGRAYDQVIRRYSDVLNDKRARG